jgi:hypothetical protein
MKLMLNRAQSETHTMNSLHWSHVLGQCIERCICTIQEKIKVKIGNQKLKFKKLKFETKLNITI